MMQEFESHHFVGDGFPSGGHTYGPGFSIAWQNGPLGRGSGRKPANGAFVETILAAVKDRLEFYQATQFNCEANRQAIMSIDDALFVLNERTAEREARQVERTHAK